MLVWFLAYLWIGTFIAWCNSNSIDNFVSNFIEKESESIVFNDPRFLESVFIIVSFMLIVLTWPFFLVKIILFGSIIRINKD